MELTSSAFEHTGPIPLMYSCEGSAISPPLSFSDVPPEAQSLALIVEDPDVPKEVLATGAFVHWVLYCIPPDTRALGQGVHLGSEGANGTGTSGYVPMCPPAQFEPKKHRYVFTLYALDSDPQFEEAPTKEALLAAMEGHILATAELIGTYEKQLPV